MNSQQDEQQRFRHWPAAQGWQWVRQGFGLFMRAPGEWIVIALIWLLLQAGANLLPLGPLAMAILGPVLTAGMLAGCLALETGGSLRIAHLFSAFSSNRVGALALLGLATLGLFALFAVLVSVLGLVLVDGASLDTAAAEPAALLWLLSFSLLLLLPLVLAMWFATALVALQPMPVFEALRTSYRGCWRNLAALSVFGLIMIPLGLIAVLPLGLGLLVLVPVTLAANYRGYVDIFGARPDAPPAPPVEPTAET